MNDIEFYFWLRNEPTQIQFKFSAPALNIFTSLVPSQQMLRELIVFPEITATEKPTYVERYQIRPQICDLESERLLVERNHEVVHWLNKRLKSPTPLDVATREWCERHDFNYGVINYFENIIRYCQLILPGMPPSKAVRTKLHKVYETAQDPSKLILNDLKNGIGNAGYATWLDNRELVLLSRFEEYRNAIVLLTHVKKNPLYISEMKTAIDANNKQVRSDSRTDEKDRLSGEFDTRILTQCLICYRFHLQESKGRNRLKKYCPDHKVIYENWISYLTKHTDYKEAGVIVHGI
jgi:hypothetical protein